MDTFHPDICKALEVEAERRTHCPSSRGTENMRQCLCASMAAILTPPEKIPLHPEVQKIAGDIDHTYLTITHGDGFTDEQQILRLCREAAAYGTASVCVRPERLELVRNIFRTWGVDNIALCTVINFPKEKGGRGGVLPETACVEEALAAQRAGATEFDVVIDYEAILRGDRTQRAYWSIQSVADAVKSHDSGAIVKAILETATLRKHGGVWALSSACTHAIAGGADYLKTSTGYAPEGGATVEDVKLLHEEAEPCGVLVKASGGITTLDQLLALRRAGASRFGIGSGTIPILEEAKRRVAQAY